jgi:hypothetical protein
MHKAGRSQHQCDDFLEIFGRMFAALPLAIPGGILLVLLASSNFWWTNDRVLGRLRVVEPEVLRIVSVQRNIWNPNLFAVEFKNGTRENYILDTDVRQHAYFWRR